MKKWMANLFLNIYLLQLIVKRMFVAVAREHVNVTKTHSVAFALVSRDLKVTAGFTVLFHLSLCIQVSL